MSSPVPASRRERRGRDGRRGDSRYPSPVPASPVPADRIEVALPVMRGDIVVEPAHLAALDAGTAQGPEVVARPREPARSHQGNTRLHLVDPGRRDLLNGGVCGRRRGRGLLSASFRADHPDNDEREALAAWKVAPRRRPQAASRVADASGQVGPSRTRTPTQKTVGEGGASRGARGSRRRGDSRRRRRSRRRSSRSSRACPRWIARCFRRSSQRSTRSSSASATSRACCIAWTKASTRRHWTNWSHGSRKCSERGFPSRANGGSRCSKRQHASLLELAENRSTLAQQLDNAVLMLSNLRLDMVKLRTSGLQSGLSDVSISHAGSARVIARHWPPA